MGKSLVKDSLFFSSTKMRKMIACPCDDGNDLVERIINHSFMKEKGMRVGKAMLLKTQKGVEFTVQKRSWPHFNKRKERQKICVQMQVS